MDRPASSIPLLHTLAQAPMRLEGQFVWGSNYTFLARLDGEAGQILAVYKPSRGEQPLWDFPAGTLAAREVAAYLTSQALGWDLVPPTVWRLDAPAGPGSVQLYVEADPDRHYFTFSGDEKARLGPVVIFDALINNADRKAGHVLLGTDDHLWLIDHGVCFHVEDKLRTVIWDFAGEAIPEVLLVGLRDLSARLKADERLRADFAALLSAEEVAALERRADRLSASGRFPLPGQERPYPWPLV